MLLGPEPIGIVPGLDGFPHPQWAARRPDCTPPDWTHLMLRYALAAALGLAVVVAAGSTTTAQDKKGKVETKTTALEGKLVCTKCTLDETKTCEHAVKVKDGDKEITYYLVKSTEKDFKAYHGKVCPAGSDLAVKVTGVVSEKDGKKYVNAAKVEPTK